MTVAWALPHAAPVDDSIGKKLLQMMGWRAGLGVGSRQVRCVLSPPSFGRVERPSSYTSSGDLRGLWNATCRKGPLKSEEDEDGIGEAPTPQDLCILLLR